jgi:aminoglycoside phosphotransferase (APT) family kinase protein
MTEKTNSTGEFDIAVLERLGAWLTANGMSGSGLPRLEKFVGGQSNPTYRFKWGDQTLVLRRKPFGTLLPKAHMIEREFRALHALKDTDMPVAKVRGLCEDPSVLGVAFYVMDFLEGRIFWDPRLPELDRTARRDIFGEMNRTVARLHSIDPAAVGLENFGRAEGFMPRQIGLWTNQYRAAVTLDIPAMNALIEWLPRNVPNSSGNGRIFHGDLRLDNMIFHPTEPRILAVLDWELATLGDPLADLAYHAMIWRVPPQLFRGLKGEDLAALNVPAEKEYIADYCRNAGRDELPDMTFYSAFAFFRLAAILQGIAKRAVGGNASSADAVDLGARAAPVAQIGWKIVNA